VRIIWKDRFSNSNPIVLPGGPETLLGVIPLEDMDLIVDTVDQKLAGKHGDKQAYFVR
jgi:hypothetical protein